MQTPIAFPPEILRRAVEANDELYKGLARAGVNPDHINSINILGDSDPEARTSVGIKGVTVTVTLSINRNPGTKYALTFEALGHAAQSTRGRREKTGHPTFEDAWSAATSQWVRVMRNVRNDFHVLEQHLCSEPE